MLTPSLGPVLTHGLAPRTWHPHLNALTLIPYSIRPRPNGSAPAMPQQPEENHMVWKFSPFHFRWASDACRWPPKSPERAPRGAPKAPQTARDALKSPPRRPKRLPRAPPDRVPMASDRPREPSPAREPPGGARRAPRDPEHSPNTAPREDPATSKMPPSEAYKCPWRAVAHMFPQASQ